MMFAMIGLGANAIIPNIDAQNVTNSSQDVLKGVLQVYKMMQQTTILLG